MKTKTLTILALAIMVGGISFSSLNLATMDFEVASAAKNKDNDKSTEEKKNNESSKNNDDESSSEDEEREEKCTSILPGSWCGSEDTKEGDAVKNILNLVLYVITAGVGVLGFAGIIITGVQYATAADNDAQVAAAKKRMLNIVIGLALWATFFALVKWLTLGPIGSE